MLTGLGVVVGLLASVAVPTQVKLALHIDSGLQIAAPTSESGIMIPLHEAVREAIGLLGRDDALVDFYSDGRLNVESVLSNDAAVVCSARAGCVIIHLSVSRDGSSRYRLNVERVESSSGDYALVQPPRDGLALTLASAAASVVVKGKRTTGGVGPCSLLGVPDGSDAYYAVCEVLGESKIGYELLDKGAACWRGLAVQLDLVAGQIFVDVGGGRWKSLARVGYVELAASALRISDFDVNIRYGSDLSIASRQAVVRMKADGETCISNDAGDDLVKQGPARYLPLIDECTSTSVSFIGLVSAASKTETLYQYSCVSRQVAGRRSATVETDGKRVIVERWFPNLDIVTQFGSDASYCLTLRNRSPVDAHAVFEIQSDDRLRLLRLRFDVEYEFAVSLRGISVEYFLGNTKCLPDPSSGTPPLRYTCSPGAGDVVGSTDIRSKLRVDFPLKVCPGS